MPLLLLALGLTCPPAAAAPADPLTGSLLSALPAVERCRTATAARREVAVGSLSVTVEPGDEGAVIGSATSLELAPSMIACITQSLETVRLPAVASEYEASWTFPAKGALQLVVHALGDDAQPVPLAPPPARVEVPALLDSTTAFVVAPGLDHALRAQLPAIRRCRDDARRSGARADGPVTIMVYVLGGQPVLGPARSKTVGAPALACIDAAVAAMPVPGGVGPAQALLYLPLSGAPELNFGRAKLTDVGPAYAARSADLVDAHAPEIAACLVNHGDLGLDAPVEVAISGEGNLLHAALGSEGPTATCVGRALTSLRFEAFDADSTVLSLRLDRLRPIAVPAELAPIFAGCLDSARSARVTIYRGSPALAAELGATPTPLPPNLDACLALARKALPAQDQVYFLAARP